MANVWRTKKKSETATDFLRRTKAIDSVKALNLPGSSINTF